MLKRNSIVQTGVKAIPAILLSALILASCNSVKSASAYSDESAIPVTELAFEPYVGLSPVRIDLLHQFTPDTEKGEGVYIESTPYPLGVHIAKGVCVDYSGNIFIDPILFYASETEHFYSGPQGVVKKNDTTMAIRNYSLAPNKIDCLYSLRDGNIYETLKDGSERLIVENTSSKITYNMYAGEKLKESLYIDIPSRDEFILNSYSKAKYRLKWERADRITGANVSWGLGIGFYAELRNGDIVIAFITSGIGKQHEYTIHFSEKSITVNDQMGCATYVTIGKKSISIERRGFGGLLKAPTYETIQINPDI